MIEEYWKIAATVSPAGAPAVNTDQFKASLAEYDERKFEARLKPKHMRSAMRAAIGALLGRQGRIETEKLDRADAPVQDQHAPAAGGDPVTASGCKRTMKVAQELYEGIEIDGSGPMGLITYMRTDSLRALG